MSQESFRDRIMSRVLVSARSMSGMCARVPVPLLLVLTVVIPQAPFLTSLGFYGDDWVFLSTFDASVGRSPVALFDTVFDAQPWARVRPAQLGYLATLYWMFGEWPLGYHLCNLAVFTGAVTVFYLALRQLKEPSAVCVAVPLIYAVLPHYSTDRFWIAASQANLSIFGLVLNLYSALRMLRARRIHAVLWAALSVLALLLSGLAYEVAVPLFLVNLVLIWQRSNRRPAAMVLLVALLGTLGAIIGFKFFLSDRAIVDGGWIWRAARILYGSTRVNVVEYGVFLPFVLWKIVRYYPMTSVFGVATAVGLSALARLSAEDVDPEPRTSVGYWFRLLILGGIVYALGYAVFLATNEVGFSTTGVVNRTAIAAAIGIAMMLVAGAALIKGGRYFAPFIAVGCFCGVLINGTLASMWTAASDQQRQVLTRVRASLPVLPPRTTVLLDGVCPNIGPAPVFESAWDVGSALRLAYRDPTIAGDVLSPMTRLDSAGVYNVIYGETNRHLYSDRLIVLDYRSGNISHLYNESTASAYLSQVEDRWSCPTSQESKGVEVFSWQSWGKLLKALRNQYRRSSSGGRPFEE